MSEIKKRKLEAVLVTVPNAGVANQAYGPAAPYKPDDSYQYIIGVWVKVISLANQPYVNVQIRDQFNVIVEPVHSDLLSAGESASANDKFFKIDPIKCDGRTVTPGVIAPGSPNADIVVQFVFELVDELIEVVGN